MGGLCSDGVHVCKDTWLGPDNVHVWSCCCKLVSSGTAYCSRCLVPQDYICSVWVVSQGFLIKSCKKWHYLRILDDTEVWGCLVTSFYQRFLSSLVSVDCAAYPFQNCFVVKADLYFREQISVLFLYLNPTNTCRHQY